MTGVLWIALAAVSLTAVRGPLDVTPLPPDRDGQDRVGTRFQGLPLERLLDDAPPPSPPRATLYRWWTDSCPFCESSLPAVEQLRTRYQAQGLAVVAVYHPKPPRPVTDRHVRAVAERLGYRGPVAVDEDWSALRRAYLIFKPRSATSVTFLVDADGVTRFVHPGPEFFPSDQPEHARADADFRALEDAVKALLAPPDSP